MGVKLTLTKTAAANKVDVTAVKNIKVVDENGNTLMGPSSDLKAFGFADTNNDNLIDDGNASASVTKTYTDSFYVTAGTHKKVKVVAELSATADSDLEKISAEIVYTDDSSFKDTDTNKTIDESAITPLTIVGKTHNVVSNSLTMATASTPSATTIIKGSKGVKVAGVSLKAGDAGALKVKSMKFTFDGTNAKDAKSILTNTKLVDSNGVVLDSSNISDGGTNPDTVTFDGFSYEVAK